jgi:hypothetical protein
MVALTSSMIELVNATIKYAMAPLEVGFKGKGKYCTTAKTIHN